MTIEETISLALDDISHGYRLGFFVGKTGLDGRKHEPRITTSRRGVRIQGRTEYTAVRPVDAEDDRRQLTPDLIAASPFDASTLRFTVEPRAGSLRLRVDPADLVYRDDTASLAAMAIEYRENGERVAPRDAVRVDWKRGEEPVVDVPSSGNARGRVRIVLMDRTTLSFGTCTLAIGSANR